MGWIDQPFEFLSRLCFTDFEDHVDYQNAVREIRECCGHEESVKFACEYALAQVQLFKETVDHLTAKATSLLTMVGGSGVLVMLAIKINELTDVDKWLTLSLGAVAATACCCLCSLRLRNVPSPPRINDLVDDLKGDNASLNSVKQWLPMIYRAHVVGYRIVANQKSAWLNLGYLCAGAAAVFLLFSVTFG